MYGLWIMNENQVIYCADNFDIFHPEKRADLLRTHKYLFYIVYSTVVLYIVTRASLEF
jgi:hypothetical protein